MKEFDYICLSLGAGRQSTAMAVCSNLGLHGVPRADIMLFADTGDEPAHVYVQLRKLALWSEIPIEVVQRGDGLLSDIKKLKSGEVTRVGNIPLFTKGGRLAPEGKLRRQCTFDYKMSPCWKAIREKLGYKPGQVIKERVGMMIGITADEASRMKPSSQRWMENLHPMAMAGLRTEDCENICKEHLGWVPKKSACVFCPFHSNVSWRHMKETAPHEFERACVADEILRDLPKVDNECYVHRSLVPLREAKFHDERQGEFGFDEECEGYCGV